MNYQASLHDITMTVKNANYGLLQSEKSGSALQLLKIIAFTHKVTPVKELHRFFLHEENKKERLAFLRFSTDITEIMYLATCNRIEFIFTSNLSCDKKFLARFFRNFRQDWSEEEIEFAVRHAEVYEGEDALRHMYRVASSLDSLVIGEREIITQVRKAYDSCYADGLTGDLLRLLVKSTITAAKKVYTETRIANNPVSVVSLAERKLREARPDVNSRIILIGAGETNTNIVKYLVKHGYNRFAIFNRTTENAQKLSHIIRSEKIQVTCHSLDELKNYKSGFDILITCTGAAEPLISKPVYSSLLNGDQSEKLIVDLAIPSDVSAEVFTGFPVAVIDISQLKKVAESNLEERKSEFLAAEELIDESVAEFRHLHRTRTLELKMREVPEKIREIKDKAVNDVFARELEGMDAKSRELLSKVLDYMEKKCISVPMIMAKEIILETSE